MADPNLFPDREYPDGTIWGPGDECEERDILQRLVPEYEESFRAVTGFGERCVVVKDDDMYSVQIQYWDCDTKGHIIEEYECASELEALDKAHDLLGLEFEPWRFGYPESE